MSGERTDLLIDDLLAVAGDYRRSDPARCLTSARIETWLEQFPATERYDILDETVRLVSRTYVSRSMAKNLLIRFLRTDIFERSTVSSHWQRALEDTAWLETQPPYSSQADLLTLLDEVLDERFKGLARVRGNNDASRYVLLDDALFTGNTIISDLKKDHLGRTMIEWVPENAEIWVVVPACFREGWAYAKRKLEPFLHGRKLERHCHRDLDLSGREGTAHDVLWPTSSTVKRLANPAVETYVAVERAALEEKHVRKSIFRTGALVTDAGSFSSVERRDLIEARFLEAGVRIRSESSHLRPDDRPLGFEKLRGLGFGATVITYRNAPNNAPLVLHEGPTALFPRLNRHRGLRTTAS